MAISTVGGRDRALVAVAYPVGFLLFVLPLVEFILTVWPPRTSGVMWRFGTFGLLSQALMLPTLAIVVGMLAARALGHFRMLLATAVATAIGAILLAGGLMMFIVDGIQARLTAAESLQPMVAATTIRGIAAMTVYIIVWGWMAIAGYQVFRLRERTDRRGRRGHPNRPPPGSVGSALDEPLILPRR